MKKKLLISAGIGVLAAGSVFYAYPLIAANPDKGAMKQNTEVTAQAGVATPDRAVAKYKGVTVMKSEVEANLKAMFGGQLPDNKQDFDQLPAEIKQNIIRGEVISKLLTNEVNNSDIANDPTVQKHLEEVKLKMLEREFLTRKVKEKITPSALEDRYKKFVAEWGDREEVHVFHILVENKDKAKEVLKHLSSGRKFEEVAKEYSTDPTKAQGGDLGYLSRNQMSIKPVEEAVFKLKNGEVSEPIKSDFGYHILKAADRRKVKVPSMEEMKPRLEDEMAQKIAGEYIEKLLSDAKFELLPDPYAKKADGEKK